MVRSLRVNPKYGEKPNYHTIIHITKKRVIKQKQYIKAGKPERLVAARRIATDCAEVKRQCGAGPCFCQV